MELPLSYSFSKHNKFTLTNSKSSSILHVCGNLNLSTLSEIQDLLLNNVERKNYSEEDFNNLLTELYTENNQNYDLENIDDIDLEDIASSISPSEDLLDDKNEGPIIKLINATITKAINSRASDIHLEPFENKLSIRFRIDGVLREILQYKNNISQMVISRIKIMSKLDISERRLPQDGRISISIGQRNIDLRVSTLPSSFGERVVLRILEKDSSDIGLNELGFNANTLNLIRSSLKKRRALS